MMYYDRSGIPITFDEWARLSESPAYKRVALTILMDAAHPEAILDVSTVWLGIDHGFGLSPLPVIYETMVFGEGSSLDLECVRYSTLVAAEEGHRAMVVTASATLIDPVVMEPETSPPQPAG